MITKAEVATAWFAEIMPQIMASGAAYMAENMDKLRATSQTAPLSEFFVPMAEDFMKYRGVFCIDDLLEALERVS
jgi:hypothetical protein